MSINYQKLLFLTQQTDENMLNVYLYGSRVYGTATEASDWDFIAIVQQKPAKPDFEEAQVHVQFYLPEEFQTLLDAQEISAIECLFLPAAHVWKQTHMFVYAVQLPQLRHSLSAKSANSWVKSKKKLVVEKDYDLYKSHKSMFHAFRILLFGIQLATTGKIYQYAEANTLYQEICACTNWEELFATFKPRYNHTLSAFRRVAPKE